MSSEGAKGFLSQDAERAKKWLGRASECEGGEVVEDSKEVQGGGRDMCRQQTGQV